MTISTNDSSFPNRAARRAAGQRGRKLAALGSGAVLATGAAGAAVTLTAGPAGAATFTVTNTNDAGAGSLRQAIIDANADAVEDLITFDPSVSGTITLASDLVGGITEAVDIQGPGASVLTVDGVGSFQVFYFTGVDVGTPSISGLTIHDGDNNSGGGISLYYSDAPFTFSNLVMTSNYASGDGGALFCTSGAADITVTDSRFEGNSADGGGGALYLNCGDLTVTNSQFIANSAFDSGGGLYFSGDALVVSGSTFTGNDAVNGGGLYLDGDTHTITTTTISGNTADDGGGGIELGGGTLELTGSTISGNDALYGGGLYLTGDEVTIVGSTISDNTADGSGGGLEIYQSGAVTITGTAITGNTTQESGGGLYLRSDETTLTVANSTIANNTAAGYGGGIALYEGDLTLLQTTISGNTATNGLGDGLFLFGPTPGPLEVSDREAEKAAKKAEKAAQKAADGETKDPATASGGVGALYAGTVSVTGTIISGNVGGDDVATNSTAAITADSSLFGGVSAGITLGGADNQTGVSTPSLGALANNGGPTQTLALSATSPALNMGPATVPAFTGNAFDQRGGGYPRVASGRVDIGAYEFQPIAVVPKFTG